MLFCAYLCNYVPTEYREFIAENALRFALRIEVVYAICYVESHFNARAKSSAGAIGMMQLLPSTAAWVLPHLGVEEYSEEMLYEPEMNIRIGCYYLSYLYTLFSEDWCVFAAYNAGEGRVIVWLKEGITAETIPYVETRRYVEKVQYAISRFEKKKSTSFY